MSNRISPECTNTLQRINASNVGTLKVKSLTNENVVVKSKCHKLGLVFFDFFDFFKFLLVLLDELVVRVVFLGEFLPVLGFIVDNVLEDLAGALALLVGALATVVF